uniref:Pre-mRNA-splicing factor SYF2 n=2 Tax=Ciona intestinalis TaxID=7719 RepID=F6QBK7_CIOIN
SHRAIEHFGVKAKQKQFETTEMDDDNDKLSRFKKLQQRRSELKRLNRAEVVEEDRKKKLPSNWEAVQKKAEWKLNEIEKSKEFADAGKDYDRVKLLDVSASDAEKKVAAKRRKKNPDIGFSTFEEAGTRLYQKLAQKIEPDMENYERRKEEMGEDIFYAGMNTLLPGQVKDTKAGIDRMVDDLNERKAKKKPFSRRRAYDDSNDIDYINEGNARCNRKLEKFYGQYTAEIKQNLERGTAV